MGPIVELNDPTSVKPIFPAPETIADETIAFDLIVTNTNGEISEPDSVTILVSPTQIALTPVADAGPDQFVGNNDSVQLDGSNSFDPNNSPLIYSWIQTSGPTVALSDSTNANPTFIALETTEQIDLTFQLIVTNAEGTLSEPGGVTITVNPASTPHVEGPRTIRGIIKGIIQNPLNLTNSIESSNEIKDILTDGNPDKDQRVCDFD